MNRKQQLQEIISEARSELDEIKAKENIAFCEPLIGKCYKTQNNYSCPETEDDYWWLYLKVISMTESGSGFNVLAFQVDKDGRADIRPNDYMHRNSMLRYEEIDPSEFNDEWNNVMSYVSELNP